MLLRNRFLGGSSFHALFAPEGVDTGGAPAAPAPAAPAPVVDGPINARDAGRAIFEMRQRAAEPDKPQRERAPDGKFTAKESPPPTLEGDDAAPAPQATGETEGTDPAEQPPLDRPRSWSKDRDEHWKTLDRATQELLLDHDREASSAVKKAQNEAANERKAIEAERKAATEARSRYEQAAEQSLQILQSELAKDYGDIRSAADLEKLAETDPFRAIQLRARMDRIAAQQQEVERLKAERAEEGRQHFKTWSEEQDNRFQEQFPEFADNEKAGPLRQSIVKYLTKEVGVPEGTIPKLWENEFFRDAMMQRIVYDASRYHEATLKAKAAVAAPKPAPQKPGTTSTNAAGVQDAIEQARARLDKSGGRDMKAVASLIQAKRAAEARR